jgi:hypothetical protein
MYVVVVVCCGDMIAEQCNFTCFLYIWYDTSARQSPLLQMVNQGNATTTQVTTYIHSHEYCLELHTEFQKWTYKSLIRCWISKKA